MSWKVSLVWPEPRTVSNQSSDTIQGNFSPTELWYVDHQEYN